MLMQPSFEDCTTLHPRIEASNSFYQDMLGYKPEQTSLKQIAKNQLNEFAIQNGFNPNSLGIYLPRNQTAIIKKGDSLGLFHEYFGHGLYCEQSLPGRKLVELEKRLLEEEKQEFSNSKFSLEDLQKFRQQNPVFNELENFRQENLGSYELFAVWTEYLLSREFDLKDNFERKYDALQKNDQEVVDSAINFSEAYGDLATFYVFGLKKIQDKKRLLRLCKDIYGRRLDRTRLILHFGSGKSFSDIDLFIVSNDIPATYDPWLDVRVYRLEDIEKNIRFLNPMVTDPILTGRFIFGDVAYRNKLRQQILTQPITEEAINFSLREHEIEKRRAKNESLGRDLQNKNLKSSRIFLTNALALKNGNKVLTSDNLIQYSHILSRSEKFIELKGGIE